MSLRLAILNAVLRHGVRPFVGRTGRPEEVRRHLDLSTRLFLRGPRVAERTVEVNGVPVREFRPPEIRGDGTVLYFHGGAYVAGSPRTHRAMLSLLAVQAGRTVLAPDYRLAPEHPFPAAFDDACKVAEAIDLQSTVLGGDSAGGGLALSLLADLTRNGRPTAGLFAFSPFTDLAATGASLAENAGRDVILPATRFGELVEMVLQGADPRDPRISPLYADFDGAPPVLLAVAESEILRDDTLRLASRLEALGVDVAVETLPHAPHVWQMLVGLVPEARISLARTARFIQECLSSPAPPAGS